MTAMANSEIPATRKKISFGTFFAKYGLAFMALLIMAGFALIEPRFLNVTNLLTIVTSTSVLGIIAIGITVVMSSGEIDFAVGMEYTVIAVLLGVILDKLIVQSYIVGLILVLGLSLLIGALNGFLNVKIGIPAFIATMGVAFVCQGFAYLLTGGGLQFVSNNWGPRFTFLGQAFLFKVIPMPVVVLAIVSTIMYIYAERTTGGKTMYAVGSNVNATKYIGINAKKQKLIAFLICSFLAGLGGVMQGSLLNRVGPLMGGESALFSCLTALMLGACFLRPGVFNIPGTILGALIVTIFSNGFMMVSAPAWVRDLVLGAVMVAAVSIVTIIRRRSEKID
jgi:ribose/xylose/arabinose/galactoside ABC-type transport system permease subunit